MYYSGQSPCVQIISFQSPIVVIVPIHKLPTTISLVLLLASSNPNPLSLRLKLVSNISLWVDWSCTCRSLWITSRARTIISRFYLNCWHYSTLYTIARSKRSRCKNCEPLWGRRSQYSNTPPNLELLRTSLPIAIPKSWSHLKFLQDP